ncbi:prefoldin subunit alpha [Candidatus Woesearchaeota archaeon]|nr:prefoldin subunit alpha [Candidatus Woesearchaeota archaeon]
MSKEANIQRKYIEIQTKEHQIQKAQEQLINISHHIQELIKIEVALDEIKKTKKGTEMLVPLGSGIFARADLKDNNELLLGVGSKVHVSKDIDETKKIISNQIRNMEDLAMEVEHGLLDISDQVQIIQQDLLKIVEDNKKDE